jgi:hypothetical protein
MARMPRGGPIRAVKRSMAADRQRYADRVRLQAARQRRGRQMPPRARKRAVTAPHAEDQGGGEG